MAGGSKALNWARSERREKVRQQTMERALARRVPLPRSKKASPAVLDLAEVQRRLLDRTTR